MPISLKANNMDQLLCFRDSTALLESIKLMVIMT